MSFSTFVLNNRKYKNQKESLMEFKSRMVDKITNLYHGLDPSIKKMGHMEIVKHLQTKFLATEPRLQRGTHWSPQTLALVKVFIYAIMLVEAMATVNTTDTAMVTVNTTVTDTFNGNTFNGTLIAQLNTTIDDFVSQNFTDDSRAGIVLGDSLKNLMIVGLSALLTNSAIAHQLPKMAFALVSMLGVVESTAASPTEDTTTLLLQDTEVNNGDPASAEESVKERLNLVTKKKSIESLTRFIPDTAIDFTNGAAIGVYNAFIRFTLGEQIVDKITAVGGVMVDYGVNGYAKFVNINVMDSYIREANKIGTTDAPWGGKRKNSVIGKKIVMYLKVCTWQKALLLYKPFVEAIDTLYIPGTRGSEDLTLTDTKENTALPNKNSALQICQDFIDLRMSGNDAMRDQRTKEIRGISEKIVDRLALKDERDNWISTRKYDTSNKMMVNYFVSSKWAEIGSIKPNLDETNGLDLFTPKELKLMAENMDCIMVASIAQEIMSEEKWKRNGTALQKVDQMREGSTNWLETAIGKLAVRHLDNLGLELKPQDLAYVVAVNNMREKLHDMKTDQHLVQPITLYLTVVGKLYGATIDLGQLIEDQTNQDMQEKLMMLAKKFDKNNSMDWTMLQRFTELMFSMVVATTGTYVVFKATKVLYEIMSWFVRCTGLRKSEVDRVITHVVNNYGSAGNQQPHQQGQQQQPQGYLPRLNMTTQFFTPVVQFEKNIRFKYVFECTDDQQKKYFKKLILVRGGEWKQAFYRTLESPDGKPVICGEITVYTNLSKQLTMFPNWNNKTKSKTKKRSNSRGRTK